MCKGFDMAIKNSVLITYISKYPLLKINISITIQLLG
jgi:hypothetical protein